MKFSLLCLLAALLELSPYPSSAISYLRHAVQKDNKNATTPYHKLALLEADGAAHDAISHLTPHVLRPVQGGDKKDMILNNNFEATPSLETDGTAQNIPGAIVRAMFRTIINEGDHYIVSFPSEPNGEVFMVQNPKRMGYAHSWLPSVSSTLTSSDFSTEQARWKIIKIGLGYDFLFQNVESEDCIRIKRNDEGRSASLMQMSGCDVADKYQTFRVSVSSTGMSNLILVNLGTGQLLVVRHKNGCSNNPDFVIGEKNVGCYVGTKLQVDATAQIQRGFFHSLKEHEHYLLSFSSEPNEKVFIVQNPKRMGYSHVWLPSVSSSVDSLDFSPKQARWQFVQLPKWRGFLIKNVESGNCIRIKNGDEGYRSSLMRMSACDKTDQYQYFRVSTSSTPDHLVFQVPSTGHKLTARHKNSCSNKPDFVIGEKYVHCYVGMKAQLDDDYDAYFHADSFRFNSPDSSKLALPAAGDAVHDMVLGMAGLVGGLNPALGLIPFALNLLWPSGNGTWLESLWKKISSLIDEKISAALINYKMDDVKTSLVTLRDLLDDYRDLKIDDDTLPSTLADEIDDIHDKCVQIWNELRPATKGFQSYSGTEDWDLVNEGTNVGAESLMLQMTVQFAPLHLAVLKDGLSYGSAAEQYNFEDRLRERAQEYHEYFQWISNKYLEWRISVMSAEFVESHVSMAPIPIHEVWLLQDKLGVHEAIYCMFDQLHWHDTKIVGVWHYRGDDMPGSVLKWQMVARYIPCEGTCTKDGFIQNIFQNWLALEQPELDVMLNPTKHFRAAALDGI